ncbi:hypothetical protein As57867_010541, partial [Aphanomyces stellatus]
MYEVTVALQFARARCAPSLFCRSHKEALAMDDQAIQFGMMNSLRTNNIIFDTLICLFIPILFKGIYDSTGHLTTFLEYLRERFGKKENEVTRRIEIKQHFNSYGKVHDEEQRNHILQKAISIYLSDHLDMAQKSGRYELLEKIRTETVEDVDGKTTTVVVDDSDSDSDNENYYSYSESDELQKLSIGALPPLNDWITIEPGLEFFHEINNGDGGNANNNGGDNNNNAAGLKESTVTFLLRSSMPDASRRIDEFVNRAFKSYQDAVIAKHKKDKSRYMYMSAPTPPSTEDGSATSGVQKYKRYGLSEDKTFESLFFDEKKALMDLLDNFVNKSGKFGIKGFPYKMGLLLHGPPGTGKTSLIKAVAQYTRRHIVNISLAKIKTNQELMNLMFDLKFGLDGEDMPVTLGFDKIVFVMEDIDCASNVVMARDD